MPSLPALPVASALLALDVWRAMARDCCWRTYVLQSNVFREKRGEAVSPKILRRKGEVLAGRISNAGTAGWPKFWHWSDQNCPSLKRINQNLFQLLRCTPQRVKTSGSGLSKCPGVIYPRHPCKQTYRAALRWLLSAPPQPDPCTAANCVA
jgi:hypothetical protein